MADCMIQYTEGNQHVVANLIRLINNDEADGTDGRDVQLEIGQFNTVQWPVIERRIRFVMTAKKSLETHLAFFHSGKPFPLSNQTFYMPFGTQVLLPFFLG